MADIMELSINFSFLEIQRRKGNGFRRSGEYEPTFSQNEPGRFFQIRPMDSLDTLRARWRFAGFDV